MPRSEYANIAVPHATNQLLNIVKTHMQKNKIEAIEALCNEYIDKHPALYALAKEMQNIQVARVETVRSTKIARTGSFKYGTKNPAKEKGLKHSPVILNGSSAPLLEAIDHRTGKVLAYLGPMAVRG